MFSKSCIPPHPVFSYSYLGNQKKPVLFSDHPPAKSCQKLPCTEADIEQSPTMLMMIAYKMCWNIASFAEDTFLPLALVRGLDEVEVGD